MKGAIYMSTTVMNILATLENASVARGTVEIVTKFKGYERIGVKVEDTFNMFTANAAEQTSKFALVTSDKEANISIRNAIKGYVTINPKTAARVGLDTKVESTQYKNYTIIKNGELHTAEITVNVDNATLAELKKINTPITSETVKDGKTTQVVINFTGLEIAESDITDEELVNLVSEINALKAEEKAIKAHQPKVEYNAKYTEEQAQALEEYGIRDGIYTYIAPKTDDTPATYTTREVQYQIKGQASIPSVNDVIKKQPKKGIGKDLLDKYMELNGETDEVLTTMAKAVKAKIQARKIALQNAKLAYVNNGGTTATIEGENAVLNIKIREIEKQYTANEA